MIVYQSSLLEDEDAEAQAAGFRDIVDKMIDPAVEMCMVSSEGKSHLRPGWDRSVFILNTLAYLQSALEPFSFTAEKQGVLQALVETRVLQITEEHVCCISLYLFWVMITHNLSLQYASILVDTGLGRIIDVWKTRRDHVRYIGVHFTQCD